MRVELLSVSKASYTGDNLAGVAAGVCTDNSDYDRSLRGAMNAGHESVAEHVVFTFRVSEVSRVLLAQLTRHRIASFSVQSQRYCQAKPQMIIPSSFDGYVYDYKAKALELGTAAHELYQSMIKAGIPAEDARYILPQGTTTDLVLTMNARELRHFFGLRCCNRAQWEIRGLADKMLEFCKRECPELFADAGPGCVRGRCPEGSRSCGHPRSEEQ